MSGLRRQTAEREEEAHEFLPSEFLPPDVHENVHAGIRRLRRPWVSGIGNSGVDVGTAHHKFLQFVSLDRVGSGDELRREVARMEGERILLPGEAGLLNMDSLEAFWQSELGRRICGHSAHVYRELAFAARFAPAELADAIGPLASSKLADELVVVQGIADLAVILPDQIWLVDFKTDDVETTGLPDRIRDYEPQLKLYARSLSRIYRRRISECWLHFLSSGTAVSIECEQSPLWG